MKTLVSYSTIFFLLLFIPIFTSQIRYDTEDYYGYLYIGLIFSSFIWAYLCKIIPSKFKSTSLDKLASGILLLGVFIHPIGWFLLFTNIIESDDQQILPLGIFILLSLVLPVILTRKFRILIASLGVNLIAFIPDCILIATMFMGMRGDW